MTTGILPRAQPLPRPIQQALTQFNQHGFLMFTAVPSASGQYTFELSTGRVQVNLQFLANLYNNLTKKYGPAGWQKKATRLLKYNKDKTIRCLKQGESYQCREGEKIVTVALAILKRKPAEAKI